MRQNWQHRTISWLAEGVYDGPHATPTPSVEGPVFLGIKNITEDGRLDLSSVRHIAEGEFPRWTKRVLPRKDDIVFSYEATLNRYALIPEDLRCCLGRRMALIRVDRKKADPEFLYYYFFSDEWRGVVKRNTIVGATVDRLPIADFPDFPVRLPELDEQKRIASVLSALDAKITLNQRINAELVAMAKLLYDYWFVQFDFPMSTVQAKRLGKPKLEGKPYKSSGGPMVYNAELKREVPEGWGAGVLSDIATITMGQSPPGSSYNDSGEGSIFFQGSTDFGTRFPLTRMFTTQPTRRAKSEDILLSVRAPVGTMNVAFEDCAIGRGLAALNSKHGAIAYLYEVMKYFEQIFQRRDTAGTTFGAIGKDDLFGLKVVLADKEVISAFEKIARPMFDEQRKLEAQNRELASLRDWLLPLLMNGQVRVAEAEEKVGTPSPRASATEGLAMAAEPQTPYGKPAPLTFALEDRAAINAWVVHVSNKDHRLGRTKAEKIEHILEGHLGNDHRRDAIRDAAGPVDIKSRRAVESLMQRHRWGIVEEKDLRSGGIMYQYHSGPNVGVAVKRAETLLGSHLAEAERIVRLMKPLRTERCEVVATLYSAWNDLLKDGKPTSEKNIFIAASAEWHEHKMDIEFSEWEWGLKWLRENCLVPTGGAKPVKSKIGK